MKRMRVGIVGLLQESNTFIPEKTTLDHFREDLLLEGEQVRTRMTNTAHEVGGFIEGLEAAGLEPVPIFLARAVPYGVIETSTFDYLVRRLLDALKEAGPLDGVLAAPHGATVAENTPDADGFWLAEVRRIVGQNVPILATIDPHANLSSLMVGSTDALIAYRTNPHLDQRQTGIRAARLMARTLKGQIRPTQAAAFPSMAINIQSQLTSKPPLKDLYAATDMLAAGASSASVILGFPYADVAEMGSASVVVTDNDAPGAHRLAGQIGQLMFQWRHRFEPKFISPAEAVEQAGRASATPVVLLDMGDNIGGGAPGDGMTLVNEVRRAGVRRAFACIVDPSSAASTFRAGIGGRLPNLPLGAPRDPFVADFVVRSLHDGTFSDEASHHGGFRDFNQGPTAVIEAVDDGITIMVTSRRVPPFSLRQMTAFGVDPANFRAIVAKGVIAPMSAFGAVAAGGFIHVDTPGFTRADMTKLAYRDRRKPMFPFEDPA